MKTMTKVRILEAGLLEVAPEAIILFGEGKSQFQWYKGMIRVVDKKGEPLSNSVEHSANELSEYEQELLGNDLCSYLRSYHLDLKDKVQVSLRVLEAAGEKVGSYS